MKTLLALLVMTVLWESKVIAGNTSSLPDLGGGNPKTLIRLTSLTNFDVWAYTGEMIPIEDTSYGSVNDKNWKYLKLLYSCPPADTVPLSGDELLHCLPFGDGKGFIRKHIFVTSGRQSELPSIVLLERGNDGIVARILDEETVNQEFGLKAGCRFLGKLDDIVFYWNKGNSEKIFGRDTRTNKTLRWNAPEVDIVNGVLRGVKKDFAFIVYRRLHKLTNASDENVIEEFSSKDAESDPK